jgi:hypothetical protein
VIPVALTQETIDQVVASHRTELMAACAADVRRATEHQISLIFEIDATGAVVDATAAGGGSAERPLRGCVEKHLPKWKFPAPGAARTMSSLVSFTP